MATCPKCHADVLTENLAAHLCPGKRSGWPSGLTCAAMEGLLRFYWSPEASDQVDVREVTQLEREGLIAHKGCALWTLSEKGHAMAQHIMETPLPQPKWEMQR